MKKINQTKGILPLVLLLAAVFIIEAVLSNFSFFAYVAGNNGREDFTPPDIDNAVIYDGSRTVSLDIPSFPLNSVAFDLRINSTDAPDTTVDIEYRIIDGNSTSQSAFVRSDTVLVGIEPKRVTAFMRSQGDAQKLEISFSGAEEFVVSDIKINPDYTVGFNMVRFCVLFAFACLVYALKANGNSKKLRCMSFDTAAIISVGICVLSAFAMWFLNKSGEDGNCIFYPIEGYLENQSPYVQQFDAFIKGQLHFDIKPTDELLALENPYNPDLRSGVYYLYDRAFFGGKYYSYFGIAPIILVYFPFYLLTGVLPIDSTVTGIFSLITALFLPLAVIEWSKLRKNGANPWFSAVCAVGAFFASSVLIIQRGNTPFYYIASVAGTALVSAFAYWMVRAIGSEKKIFRLVSFFLAGISFAFAFLSRLNSVIVPAVMVAVFVIIYSLKKIKEEKITSLLTEMAVLALPVAAALGFSMWYNNARFGSPLQFGADYQLTIADASLYKLGIDGLIPSIVHYFLQPFGFTDAFPFIGFDYLNLSDYGRFVYVDMNYGIFALPFTLSLLLRVFIFKSKKASKEGKILLASGIVSMIATAFANFCLGGVIFRYTADISLAAALLSAVILIEICTYVQKNSDEAITRAVKCGAVVLTVVTVCISLASCLQLNGNLRSYSPEVYEGLKNLFVFWS